MSQHVMAQPIQLAEPVASWIPRLHPTPYAQGPSGSAERNKVWVALKKWLQNRYSWPSKALLNATLHKLCLGVTAAGTRLGGKDLVRLLCGQTAQDAVTTLAPLEIGEEAALLIYAAATADVKNCGSTGAATQKTTPAVATAAGQVDQAARVESLVEASASAAASSSEAEDRHAKSARLAATNPGPSSSSPCQSDVDAAIASLKTQLPDHFWPEQQDRLPNWMLALNVYLRTLQQTASAGAPRPCCENARSARDFVLVDEVPMCRGCFLEHGHNASMVVHMDGARATCGGIVPKPGASTEAAAELQVLATELMELITAAEEKSKEKKNLANGKRFQVGPARALRGLCLPRTDSCVACAAFAPVPSRGTQRRAG